MDNNKVGWKQGREVGRAGVVGRGGGKMQITVLEQLKKLIWKKNKKNKIVAFYYNILTGKKLHPLPYTKLYHYILKQNSPGDHII